MRNELDPLAPIVPVAYPRLLLELVQEQGFSRSQILDGILLNPEVFEDTQGRLSPMQFMHLVANCHYLTKNPGLGYEFGLRTQVTAHGFLGYAVMSCPTLRDAIALGVKFVRLRTQISALQLREEDDEAVLDIISNYALGPMRQFALDSLLVSLARAGSFITGMPMSIGILCCDYPEPPYYAAYRERLPPIRFAAGANQLRFPRHLLDRPLVLADAVAAKLAIEQCERELALLGEDDDIPRRVRALLSHGQQGYPDLESVAAQLFLSSRTLKRRLQQHGLSFQGLLDEVRRRDAIRLLGNRQLSLEQIAQQLGYTDPANFTRAFRKWTGEPPSQYRQSRSGRT